MAEQFRIEYRINTGAWTALTTSSDISLALSDYISSSGTDTTSALLPTPPAGMTAADFQAGRLSDDTNPVSGISLVEGKYTEIEFSAELDAAISSGDEIEFRITDNGVVLDTYSVTPQVTASTTVVSATTGAVIVTGYNPSVETGITVTATTGAVNVSGLAAEVEQGTTVSATTGAVVVTGYDATISAGTTISVTTGTVAVTGINAEVKQGTTISASAGTVTVVGYSADVEQAITIQSTSGAVIIAGYAATITAGTSLCTPASRTVTVAAEKSNQYNYMI